MWQFQTNCRFDSLFRCCLRCNWSACRRGSQPGRELQAANRHVVITCGKWSWHPAPPVDAWTKSGSLHRLQEWYTWPNHMPRQIEHTHSHTNSINTSRSVFRHRGVFCSNTIRTKSSINPAAVCQAGWVAHCEKPADLEDTQLCKHSN